MNPAALHEAADALARACLDVLDGKTWDARFALERASLCAMTAFDQGSPELDAWHDILGAVDDELKAGAA